MADVPSAAAALYPTLPTSSAAPEAPAPAEGARGGGPAVDRSAATTLYSASEDGIERARAVTSTGVAAAAETTSRGPDWLKTALTGQDTKEAPAPGGPLDLAALGLDPDTPITGEFSSLARALGLNQAAAEKLLPLHQKAMAEASEAYWGRVADWEQQTRAELGPQLAHVVASVTPLLQDRTLTEPAFVELLAESGFGSHPAVVRTLGQWAAAIGRRR